MTKPSLAPFASLSKRQLYSLLLKLLTLLGVVILMSVMINSLWGLKDIDNDTKTVKQATSAIVQEVALEDIRQGTIKRVLFQGQDIAVLYRPNGSELAQQQAETNALNETWRSIKANYFVFINAAGATRCPLHLSADANELKDICAGVKYDTTGRNKTGGVERLIIPPHYYNEQGKLFLGAWQASQQLSGSGK